MAGPDLLTVGSLRAVELDRDGLPALEDDPPPGMPFGRKWLLSLVDEDGELGAIAHLCSDFLAPRVWLLGLFIVGSARRGTGAAAEIYAAVEAWAPGEGARWIRLGVVVGDGRAERFWQKVGYAEVRRRTGVAMGQRVNTLSAMYKPLDGGWPADYFALVARERPEAP